MADYKKMYTLLCAAASDTLDLLEAASDEQAIVSACFLLQQAMIRAEYIYIVTDNEDMPGDFFKRPGITIFDEEKRI